jgi:hypothetical protein
MLHVPRHKAYSLPCASHIKVAFGIQFICCYHADVQSTGGIMAANELKMRWVAKDGSVFVEDTTAVKLEGQKKTIMVQKAIAFNVGKEMADYIVNLHNESLLQNHTNSGTAHQKTVAALRQ